MIEKFESMLQWSPVSSVPGRYEVSAPANSAFWAEWRADKAAVKALGISCKPAAGREWLVTWVRSIPFEVPISAGVPVEALNEQADFVPQPLPEHIAKILSDEQNVIIEVVRNGKQNFVVRARAGTGKTFTTTLSFSQASYGFMFYGIFGKKNQLEALEKIKDARVDITTLHSLGNRFIKMVWPKSQPDKKGQVEWDRIEAVVGNAPDEVRTAIHKLVGFGKNLLIVPTVGALVEIAEDRMIEAENFEDANMGGWVVEKLADAAFKVMELSKKPDPMNRHSFNDMVWLPVAMGWVKCLFPFGIIDEAQDMNAPQLEMARKACKRLGVIGDDRQCIYTFRGAMQNGLDYMKEVLNAEEFGLTVTRRCPKSVVNLVKKYVPDYQAAPDAIEGTILGGARFGTEQADLPCSALLEAKPGDAILSRANAPLLPVCLRLLRKGIPARIEGRDIGAMLLKLIEKIKAKSVPDYIAKVIAQGDRAIARLKKEKNNDAKIEAIQDQTETLIAIAQDAKNVQDIKDRCTSLFEDTLIQKNGEVIRNPKPAVVLSSVHKAKGLEWNKVYMVASTFLRPGRESREEENIFYVGCTRTKNELVFVSDPPKED